MSRNEIFGAESVHDELEARRAQRPAAATVAMQAYRRRRRGPAASGAAWSKGASISMMDAESRWSERPAHPPKSPAVTSARPVK